jgi:mastermind-like protein
LLKTEPGNDDWMKDINLDEILGSNSWRRKGSHF